MTDRCAVVKYLCDKHIATCLVFKSAFCTFRVEHSLNKLIFLFESNQKVKQNTALVEIIQRQLSTKIKTSNLQSLKSAFCFFFFLCCFCVQSAQRTGKTIFGLMDLKKLIKAYGQDTRRIETYNVDLIYNQSQPSSAIAFQPPPIQAVINNIPNNQVPASFNFYVPPPPLPAETNLQDDWSSSFSKRQPNRPYISEDDKKKRLEKLQMNNPHLKELMQKLSTPEDIQKWREERRAKFPTKERLQQKVLDTVLTLTLEEKEIQEQIHRGELPPKRKHRNFGSDRSNTKKHKYHSLKQRSNVHAPTTNDNNADSKQPDDNKIEAITKQPKRQGAMKKKPTLLEQVHHT